MAIGVKSGRIMFQRGTKAEWENSKLILLDGELAVESDTTKIKIGDGKSKYIDLPYIEIGNIRVSDLSEEDIKKITGPKGEKGDPMTFEDLNPEQKKELKGEKGDRGPQGPQGLQGKDGVDGKDGTLTGEIGGVNLIKNSDKITGWTKHDNGNHVITDEFMDEFKIQGQRIKSDAGNAMEFLKSYVSFYMDDLVPGKTYTFSIYVKNNRDVPAQLRVNGFNWNFAYELNANECKRFIITGKRDNVENYWKNQIQFQLRSADKGQFVDITVARPQLEEGDVATSWSKNPNDLISSDVVKNVTVIQSGASTDNIAPGTLIFEV